MPFRETVTITAAMTGRQAMRISASTGSKVSVTMIPPSNRIGARIPSRCIIPTMLWTL